MFRKQRIIAVVTLIVLSCFTAAQRVSAQSVSTYTLTPSSGTFTALSGATTLTPAFGDADDGRYPAVPIGFTFKYDGTNFTQVWPVTNGWMSFVATTTFQFNNTLDGSNNTNRPFVAPMYDDLDMTLGSVSHQTTGTAPNRVFTVQWLNAKWDYLATAPVISFQVKLFETTNRVQFIYRTEAGTISTTGGTFGASIGLAGTTTGSGSFFSLNNSTASPTTSTTAHTTNISTRPPNGQFYTFAPPPTASSVSISGRVLTQSGIGVARAFVVLTDSEGRTTRARTSPFGYYRVEGLISGQTYVVSIDAKQTRFVPQILTVAEDLEELNFIVER